MPKSFDGVDSDAEEEEEEERRLEISLNYSKNVLLVINNHNSKKQVPIKIVDHHYSRKLLVFNFIK